MNETPIKGRKLQRLALITQAVVFTAVALFYLEEDWRGKRAWDACKRELEATGTVVDWEKLMPAPVPDDQNFFTASTNILIRFRKAQTPAQIDAAAHLQWLPLSWPDYPESRDPRKVKSLVVAELNFLPSAAASGTFAGGNQAANFNDPAARFRVLETIEKAVGRSLLGATGIRLSELQLSNLAPVQIALRAKAQPAISDLESFLSSDLVTILGRVQIEAADRGKLRILLTQVQVTSAADYLKWSDQFIPAFDEIRDALKRPYAILPGEYSEPYMIPIPNFVTMRAVAQILAQRAQSHLLLRDPGTALQEVALIHDVCRILQKAPTGKPETLVEAMINVAIAGLYVNTIADGLRLNAWQKPHFEALQDQLKEISLPSWVAEAFRDELAANERTFESTPAYKIADLFSGTEPHDKSTNVWSRLKDPLYRFMKFAPRGWIYLNLVNMATIERKPLESFDFEHDTILPRAFDQADRSVGKFLASKSPFRIVAAATVPNYAKAVQNTTYNQTLANEAQIVCALERYRLADGEYPASLDPLVPSFIEKLPHDIIGGQPLHYRRTDDGKFLLYSVGWNEQDDGGKTALNQDGSEDRLRGDWVWKN